MDSNVDGGGLTGTTVDYPDRFQKIQESRRPDGGTSRKIGQERRKIVCSSDPARVGLTRVAPIFG